MAKRGPTSISKWTKSELSSALLDQVALVVAEARVLCGAHDIASGGWHALVTLANLPAVLVVGFASAAQESRRLDAGTAHLHRRGIRVRNVLRGECLAFVQGSFSCTVTQHRCIF